MFTVGLTGGIASGKSAAARIFAKLGVPVLDADAIAREVVAPGSDGLAELVAALGPTILTPAGNLDRARLRERIFASPALRRQVEAITHPFIKAGIHKRLAALEAPYAIVMAALLIESELAHEMDRLLVVDCPESLQIERLMARDGETEPSAKRMLSAQTKREDRLAAADDVVPNEGSLEQLARAVQALHSAYLELAHNA